MTTMPPRTRGGREEMNFSCSSNAMRRLPALGKIRRPALGVLPVQPGFLAGALLFLQLEGAGVPIVDFLPEARIDLMLDLLDLRQTARLHLRDMCPRQIDGREGGGGPFEIAVQPCPGQQVVYQRDLLRPGRAQIEVRRDPGIGCVAVRADRGELELLGDDMRPSRGERPPVPDVVLQQDDHRQRFVGIGVIDEYRSLFHQVVVFLPHDADDRFQERMPGIDESGDRLLVDPVSSRSRYARTFSGLPRQRRSGGRDRAGWRGRE